MPSIHYPLAEGSFPTLGPPCARLPYPYRAEEVAVEAALSILKGRLNWSEVVRESRPWVSAARQYPVPFWAMESLLREYPISSAEGLALMRLAEALLRVPDAPTAIVLTADQLGRAAFSAEPAASDRRSMLADLSTAAIALAKKFLPTSAGAAGLLPRLGAKTVVAAMVRVLQLLGHQFVLGSTIDDAMRTAHTQRSAMNPLRAPRFSYDMLGEGARTEARAQHYLASYTAAIAAVAADQPGADIAPEQADGISIKLSALFARYEDSQRARVFNELLPRLWTLVERAAEANLNLTIDAEESERLELSLEILDVLAARIARTYPAWRGFGLAIQAYQTRALAVVAVVADLARRHGLRMMVRLVKGAYWDAEIKRAQEGGFAGYPVFTRKENTDLSYLACACALIDQSDVIYPQFATHNAATIAAVLQLARARGCAFEMQRLHGMGESIYRQLTAHAVAAGPPIACRVYAPVGEHRDLLAYLVRRLLENGANSSFVHQLADPTVEIETLLRSPMVQVKSSAIALPADLFVTEDNKGRRNSSGADLACLADRVPLMAAVAALGDAGVPSIAQMSLEEVPVVMERLSRAVECWRARPVGERAAIIRRAADLLDNRRASFCALLVKEAHKTMGDCVAEVREAVDFCRYYADQAQVRLSPQTLPGPTGEHNELRLRGRGVFVCISPWNFPLAIFTGQVVAALVAGNTVAAKPAEQTPAVAASMVALLHEAGVPREVLALLPGTGEQIGAALVAHSAAAGVCFTGSAQVAKQIQRTLANKDGPIVPFIAETGGLNAMIVDSTALLEQVVDAVVQSAFRSAGQRCSALRLLVVHHCIAEPLIEMIRGALAELVLGDPACWASDVGPLIDGQAYATTTRHLDRLERETKLLAQATTMSSCANLVAPVMFELPRIADLKEEIFAPVLHVVRWDGDVEAVMQEINALGYGLTLGIQTRIDSRAERLAALARVGNIYVNRNMVGAVVGVQPFGGEGLSGSGPKAGGPHYLLRFCVEQTLSINTAAAGANVGLLTGVPRVRPQFPS